MPKLAFHWQVGLALILAVAAGMFSGPQGAAVPVYDFIGTLFLNALKMLVVPLIVAAIINGLSSVRGAALGRMGLLTLGYYAFSGLLAILTGLLFVNLLTPGIVDGQPAKALMGLDASTAEVEKTMADRGAGDFAQVILLLFPPNIFAAAANGQMLGIICFS